MNITCTVCGKSPDDYPGDIEAERWSNFDSKYCPNCNLLVCRSCSIHGFSAQQMYAEKSLFGKLFSNKNDTYCPACHGVLTKDAY